MLVGFTLEDLVEKSGISLRTIRYYIQEGLLPGPSTQGKYATYSLEHLERLQLITYLKSLYLPLKEIRQKVTMMTPEEIRQVRSQPGFLRFLDEQKQGDLTNRAGIGEKNSALDYIRNLKSTHAVLLDATEPPVGQTMAAQSAQAATDQIIANRKHYPEFTQETYLRLELTEGVFLHISPRLSSSSNYKLQKLLDYAQTLFKK